jgi:hypothetical protein
LRLVRPGEPPPEPDGKPILSHAEAKKRFLIYSVVKLSGLAALFGGVFLGRGGLSAVSVVLLVAGAVSLFIRPKMLGLTTRP